MAGNNSTVGLETITFTDNMSFDGTERGGAMTTDGELWIGSTSGRHVKKGVLTSPDNSLTIGYNSPNLTAIVNRSVVQDLHTARYIVSAGGLTDGANYTTIQSALNAAQSTGVNQTIFIQPGTYTENLTLVPGINLIAYVGDALTPNVTIAGTLTLTTAGTVSISGIRLQTNGSFFLAITGSAASIVNLDNCYLNCSNNIGISFTTSSSSAQIFVNNCTGNLATTGIALYSHTSSGNLWFYYSYFDNTGGSTTANNNSSGNVFLQYCNASLPLTTSSTGSVTIVNSIVTGGSATAALTTAGTGTSALESSRLLGGTASALSIGAGTVVEVKGNSTFVSSNANAVTGAGQIKFNKLDYYSSSGNNTTTKTAYVSEFAIQTSTLQPAFSAIVGGAVANVTGDGTAYTIIAGTEIFDQNSNYNSGTGVFTAPITGRYQFNCALGINGMTAAFTSGQFTLVTSNRSYLANRMNYGAIRDGTDLDLAFSVLADMDAGDTASLLLTVSGSTKTVGIRADGTNAYTSFSGYLVA